MLVNIVVNSPVNNFQSCCNEAITSWVITSTIGRVLMCLAPELIGSSSNTISQF